jgi:hypothetical protein
MVMTERFAEGLGVELGEVPVVTDYGMIWDMLAFVGDGESGISGKVSKSQNNECAALVRLSSMILLAPSLYSNDFPEDEEAAKFQRKPNNYVKNVIGKSAAAAKFKSKKTILDAVGPYYDKMDKEESVEEVGKLMLKTMNSVDALLAQEQKQNNASVGGTEDEVEAKAMLSKCFKVNSLEQAREFAIKLKPTKAACDAVLKPELAARAATAYEQLFADDEMVIAPRPGQTEIRLRKVTTEQLLANDKAAREMPGGYREIAS